jgi:SAM-dependent methyltransferase
MQPESWTDVPSPIDFRRMSDAREWAESAMVKRRCREHFFARIGEEIARLEDGSPRLLELGSGPGFLARHVLETTSQLSYFALDFSPAMHTLAKARLGPMADRVRFIEADFKSDGWARTMPRFDVVASVQAVHELRHKRHAALLYRTVWSLLRPPGVFLMCDHVVGSGGMTDRALFMTAEEHESALRAGGFASVDPLLEEGGLILYRALRQAV